jgi:hypothetical protein
MRCLVSSVSGAWIETKSLSRSRSSRPTYRGPAYAPHADDTQGLAPHVEAAQLLRPPPLPFSGPEQPLPLAQATRRGEHEHEGDVGGRLVEDAGGVRDDYAPLGGGPDIYVVVADGHVGDDPQAVPRGVHGLAVHLLGRRGEDAARAAEGLEELVAGRRPLVQDGHVEVIEEAEAGLGYLARNQYLLGHGRLPSYPP